MIFVSPAERHRAFADLGINAPQPEQMGVDFLWAVSSGWVGFQRKKFPGDLLASINDKRLAKELQQMQSLEVKGIILEGEPIFTSHGTLLFSYGNMTYTQLVSLQYSLQVNHGLVLLWTKDEWETAEVVKSLYAYTLQGKPSKLAERGKPRIAGWGLSTSEAFAVYLLESVPGVGHQRAKDIVKHLGVPLPLHWTGDKSVLLSVPGVGPKTVEAIMEAFNGRLSTN